MITRMTKESDKDHTLETLLNLSGTTYIENNGYWYKIEAWKVEKSDKIPHGVRYNLTFHDNHNTRIIGFDNAHAPKSPAKRKFAGRILAYDHKHKTGADKGVPYEFSTAQQLLNDFLSEVNRIMREVEK